MIDVSIYYLVGSVIGLPIITTLINRYYYNKKREEVINYYQDIIQKDREEYNRNTTKFNRNRDIISKFMETRMENIK